MSSFILGEQLAWPLDINAEQVEVAKFREDDASDVAELTRRAISKPVDFPPLHQAVVPGDRIVLALGDEIAVPEQIVESIADYLRGFQEGLEITVLTTAGEQSESASTSDKLASTEIHHAVHNPHDRDALAYLAATETGLPIYLNRLLCDADLVLPITSVAPGPVGEGSLITSLFPRFSDQETNERIQRIHSQANGAFNGTIQEVKQVGWQLGVQMAVAVIPGHGSNVHDVVGGDPVAALRDARQAANKRWSLHVTRRVPLVVLVIEGRPSWERIIRALDVGECLVEPGGAMVLCASEPLQMGTPLREVQGESWHDSVVNLVGDVDPALVGRLAEYQERGSIYSVGLFDPDLAEEIGLAPVESPQELSRLIERFGDCIIVPDAQNAWTPTG